MGRQPGVVGQGGEASLRQQLGGGLHLLAGHGVNDAGLAAALLQKGGKLGVGVGLGLHGVANVGAVEAADELLGAIQFQPRQDFPARLRIGGGGQRHSRHAGKPFAQNVQAQIVLPEVVPPLGDAMGLVDGDDGQLHVRQQRQGLLLQQPLRS